MAKRGGEDPEILHRRAQTVLLAGLAAGNDDVFELMLSVRPCDVRGHFTPDVALLEVAAAALGLACPPGSERLEYEGRTDRYLSDLVLDRTLRRRTQYALYAAACMRGGLHPDLLGGRPLHQGGRGPYVPVGVPGRPGWSALRKAPEACHRHRSPFAMTNCRQAYRHGMTAAMTTTSEQLKIISLMVWSTLP